MKRREDDLAIRNNALAERRRQLANRKLEIEQRHRKLQNENTEMAERERENTAEFESEKQSIMKALDKAELDSKT